MTESGGGLPAEIAALREELLAFALSLPEAWEDYPWGESVAKVRKKVFAFFGVGDGTHPAGLTVKLPESGDHALSLPEGSPTGYGLGRSGWVTIGLSSTLPPMDVLTDWIMESYRALAPKSLAAKLTCADE
ncbi:MAG TPA: MmcQ/YjbR family DNA-binding protein [Frankiaceae bacterium]|nr:MmcQ/YjbR family DNA-binding protein [Frankiaceae bacterium]